MTDLQQNAPLLPSQQAEVVDASRKFQPWWWQWAQRVQAFAINALTQANAASDAVAAIPPPTGGYQLGVNPTIIPAVPAAGMHMLMDGGSDGDPGPPGQRGADGATGATGAAGASIVGPPGRDGEDADAGWPMFPSNLATQADVAVAVTAVYVPTLMSTGETFSVPTNKQVLFTYPIDIADATLDVIGDLVEVA